MAVKTFMKNNRQFKGICFTDKSVLEEMEYEFADFIVDDIKIIQQLNFGRLALSIFDKAIVSFDREHNRSQTLSEMEEMSEVIVVQMGTSYDNHNGTWDRDYEGTLYVFHNDWLMCDGRKLFVADENYIKTFIELKKVDINA